MSQETEQTGDIQVQLPLVLTELIGCDRRISVRGGCVADALEDLVRRHPTLSTHLFDDTGALRRHVLCFRNDVAVEHRADLRERLQPGDRLTLMGSVAGG